LLIRRTSKSSLSGKSAMNDAFFGKSSAYSICLCIPLLFGGSIAKAEDMPQFRNDIIMQVPLGKVESRNYALRATITTMQPFAKIPPHVHEFGGIRYVLEGAITVNWKDGGTQTFSQGSTYFEGPGQNHPPGVMAASNPTDKVTRILIIEWIPVD
jgi:quercetin dioxygenase-like cupin family protein